MALVQHAHDLDQARRDRAVIENMHRTAHLRLLNIAARVPEVKASDAGPQIGSASRCRPLGAAATLRIAAARIAA
jgi:hypothetical protein